MLVLKTPQEVRSALDGMQQPLGFVPTMGALHAGHLRLAQEARAECKTVVTSIFVNPLQFAENEDFDRYPRSTQKDIRLLEQSGVDLLFAPERDTMFPAGFSTFVEVGKVATGYEGAVRPHHFRGVATVITKLLNIVRPDVLYLGQKDAQQVAVLHKLVRDLEVPVDVRIIATERERDGLALSSRNAYLSALDRAAAPSLYGALQEVHTQLRAGRPLADALAAGRAALSSRATLDYLELVDARTFEALTTLRPPAFIIGAASFGTTRLIDNIWIRG